MPTGQASARQVKLLAATLAAILYCSVSGASPANAFQLVTPMEANAGPYVGHPEPVMRGIAPGPRIVIRSPPVSVSDNPTIHIPLKLDVEFDAEKGAKVDMDSLKVIYKRLWGIDITDRIRPYVTKEGIFAENAQLPLGEHAIEIEIKDNFGRITTATMDFTVVK